MNKIAITAILILCSVFTQAQLGTSAKYFKQNYPTEYESTIKRHALQEWGEDYTMVVYEINKQADAIVDICTQFESKHTRQLVGAIREWSIDGYVTHNLEQVKAMKVVDRKTLIKIYCDWSMVKYEYSKQVKAKGSF